MSDCSCCCDEFSLKRGKTAVPCQFCDFSVCQDCQKSYGLAKSTEMHCMSCKKEWSLDHLSSYFPKTFVTKTLKNHREDLLLERQKALLPQSQHAALTIKKMTYLEENLKKETEAYNAYDKEKRSLRYVRDIHTRSRELFLYIEALTDEEHLLFIKEALCDFMTNEKKNIERVKVSGYKARRITEWRGSAVARKDRDISNNITRAKILLLPPEGLQDAVQIDRVKVIAYEDKLVQVIDIIKTLDREFDRSRWSSRASHSYNTFIFEWAQQNSSLDIAVTTTDQRIEEITEKINALDAQQTWNDHPRRLLDRYLAFPAAFVSDSSKKIKKCTWTWSCPCSDCKGFLDDKSTCGTCEKKFCKDCNVQIDPDADEKHVCDEDTKKTIKMLKRDSKPCPKCPTVIHKIDGCDQMWCPDCKTAFSWKNGTIETRVHNPHYYEYLRNTQGFVPRDPADNPEAEEEECGFRFNPDNAVFLGRFEYQNDAVIAHPTYHKVWRVLTHALHLKDWNWRVPTDTEVKQLYWRGQFISGNIDEATWKKQLQRQDKDLRKRSEFRNIIDTYVQVGCDILRDMTNGNLDINEKVKKHSEITEYFQEAFAKVSKLYNCVGPKFTEDKFDIITHKH